MSYNWPGPYKPFAHQKKTTQFLIRNRRALCLNDMGTGKSASTLWALDFLMLHGFVQRALVVAPLSTLTKVWLEEAFKLMPHRRVTVLHHRTSAKRRALYDSPWDIGIINYDGVGVLEPQILHDPRMNLVVIDEATAYKNANTERFEIMQRIATKAAWLWLLTGTPCAKAPTDAFGLAKLVDNPQAPRFFKTFRSRTMVQVAPHKWVPAHNGYDKAFEVLQPAIRYKKEDCGLDLPPMTFQSWEVPLTAHQRRAYSDMQKSMRLEFADNGGKLPAANAADKINKLRQIACGVIRDTQTGEYLTIDHKPRAQAVLDAIDQAAAKVIVVVPFKGIIAELNNAIAKEHSVAIINGDVPPRRRNEIITAFKEARDPHVLLVHPKVMAHGLTLTEADTMVFYAPIYSNEEVRQVIERINRPGQTRKMTVVRIGSTAVEWGIYNTLDQRAAGEEFLLDLYKNAMNETP